MYKILIFLVFILISGCVTSYDPSNFEDYSSDTYYQLNSEFRYSERRGIGILWEQGLKEGKYIAKYEDKKGYYFVGENSALCKGSPECSGFNFEGGIWVSKKNKNDVRIFEVYYMTQPEKNNVKNAGLIIEALANSDEGQYFIYPKNKEFIQKILISKHSKTNK
jgi:hypothetical protein